MNLAPCPDCGSSDFVNANQHADSYHSTLFWNVACRNPKCQQKFWPMNKMPRCTEGYSSKEQAERAWNEGKHTNHSFSIGGRWVGD